jgi:hypothetical protein
MEEMFADRTNRKENVMAYLDWKIEGKKIDLCNCNYGCPCQFYAPPTYERCEGISFLEIEKGHFGDVPLDGLRLAMIAAWPGSIHEGEGGRSRNRKPHSAFTPRQCAMTMRRSIDQSRCASTPTPGPQP